MPWWAWLLIAVGVAGFIVAWRAVFRATWDEAARNHNSYLHERRDWGDVTFAVFCATCAALAFPFTLIVLAVLAFTDSHDAETFARRVGGETRAQRRLRRDDELRERERANIRRERELGIKPHGSWPWQR